MDAKPEWTPPGGLALDLGWCIVRPITDEQWAYIKRVKRPMRERAILACYAGLRLRQWSKPTLEQRRELWYASGWMLRPHLDPYIGRVVSPEALKAMIAPPPPPSKRKPYTRRTAVQANA